MHGGDRTQQEVASSAIQKEAAEFKHKHNGCDERNALPCEGYITTKLRSDAERQMTAAVLRDSGLADSKNELAVTI